MMSILRLSRTIGAFAFAGVVAGCSLDANEDIPPIIPLEEQQWAPGLNVDLATMTKLSSGVYIKDNVIGAGTAVSGTPTVRFYYSGYLASGVQFDSNVGEPSPLQYELAGLIPGFSSGLQGMQVGGKRRLVIPSALAYGPPGQGVVPPNANLVFDIELVGVI
jgi:FKBP-type peptidyl-prolyl cis-trans isomerase FkpA